MQPDARILFVVPFSNSDANAFVHALANGMKDWNVTVMDSRLTILLFETRKYDLVHFFLPVEQSRRRLMRNRPTTAVFQTLLSNLDQADSADAIFASSVITFSEKQNAIISQIRPNIKTEVILPCIPKIEMGKLEPSSIIRERYAVQDRIFIVALSDFHDQQHFAAFLYTAREYQRRGGFRFLIPQYREDKQTLLWRKRLQNAITQEKLTATTLLDPGVDLHSLIDSADMALYMNKNPVRDFSFPLIAVEALCAGKPVIAYSSSPISEVVEKFQPAWVASVYEDFSRISKDLLKQTTRLEQISTELARYARSRMDVFTVAERYKELYKPILKL